MACRFAPRTTSMRTSASWENLPPSNTSETLLWGDVLRRAAPKISVFLLLLGSLTSQFEMSPSRGSSISLGSAAISSVTDILSPILPFAGGLDLRREDYQFWSTGNWWERLQDVVEQVKDAFESANGELDDDATGDIRQKAKDLSLKKTTQYNTVISSPTMFVSLDMISQLTLGEVAQTFKYAVESGQSSFSEQQFVSGLSSRLKPVIAAMQSAVEKSRMGASNRILSVGGNNGQVDALKFAAAMRIFAEWRLLRQVPEGYKGYAVGMSLGHKDVVQNVAKIELASQQWLDYQEGLRMLEGTASCSFGDSEDLYSPTLFDLLNFEVELDVHPALPRLKEKSAAMGLLWVKRQLFYQSSIFENIVQVPSRYESAKDAVDAAYTRVYGKYHGWAVQKIFKYSFQAAPETEKIFRHMNPLRLNEARAEAFRAFRTTDMNNNSDDDIDLQREDEMSDNPFVAFFDHIGGEWDKFAHHVAGEWDKFARHVVEIFDNKSSNGNEMVGQLDGSALSEEMETLVTELMIQDARTQIASFLTIVNPLLTDLELLFDKLNMDDPTKV
ncbi:hypothetical protein FisN_3Hh367 [Fistulifera solaris]|uniref:Glycolipid transfer protein domain-containing protein n=1 Tax=Fistulifera solaris TaxID=1519565 RepID=A0A1Z5JQL4_FISSO|nr:hypothetical protein FisN_3Hh367 [Fistulifera solaris]|eukprot:GAX16152.1 hypothetical protein FisN_3Hh367 [Fistulifera solaris]